LRRSGDLPNPVHSAGTLIARHSMTEVSKGHHVAELA
jgi:hypothetical protein